MFFYELHCHTNACSDCSRQSPEELVAAYYGAGYHGVVLTDHFACGNTCVSRRLPLEAQMAQFFAAWDRARRAAADWDFDVLFGLEFGFSNAKEVLLYGLPRAFYEARPWLQKLDLPELADTVHQAGGLLYHAHPYRARDYIPDPDLVLDVRYLDGIEVANYYDTPEESRRAVRLARENGLLMSAGSDNHTGLDTLRNGMVFSHRVRTNEALPQALRAPDTQLLVHGNVTTIVGGLE